MTTDASTNPSDSNSGTMADSRRSLCDVVVQLNRSEATEFALPLVVTIGTGVWAFNQKTSGWESFAAGYGSGDLLLISSLILLGTARRLIEPLNTAAFLKPEQVTKAKKEGEMLFVAALGVLVLFFLARTASFAFDHERIVDPDSQFKDSRFWIAAFSFPTVILTISLCKWLILRHFKLPAAREAQQILFPRRS